MTRVFSQVSFQLSCTDRYLEANGAAKLKVDDGVVYSQSRAIARA